MVMVVVAFVAGSNRRKTVRARQRRAADEAAIPGLAEYAAAQGWNGPSGDPRFNQQFLVLARSAEYATAVITERTMALLLERNDWAFFMELDRLICVCGDGLATAQDYANLLGAVTRFAALIPAFVPQDRGAQF